MKISIITVCYNAANCIEKAIKSVLSQTYNNIEYIIIDGKSTDGTLDIINNYRENIAAFISEKDNGIYDAMNKGIQIATGDIIYFLNSDDTLYDECVIQDVVKEFERTKGLSLLYGNVIYEDKKDNSRETRNFGHITRKNIIHENLCHQAVFAKHALFRDTCGFDLTYTINADYDWLLKVFLSKKYAIQYFDRVIAVFNYGGAHVKDVSLTQKERFAVRAKYYGQFSFRISNFIYRAKRKLLC